MYYLEALFVKLRDFPPPLLKGILFTAETQARRFEAKTTPLKCSFFQNVCVFVVQVFLGGSEQSVLLWSSFSNRRHSVCTGSSCPWPKPTDQQQRRTRSTIASAFSWHQGRGALPHPQVVFLQASSLWIYAAARDESYKPSEYIFLQQRFQTAQQFFLKTLLIGFLI